jgi:hypothetical protein
MKRENMSGRNWRGKTCQVGTNMLFFVQNWICSYAFDWLILKFMKRSAANLYQYHRWRTNLDVHLDRSFHTARGPGHRNLCGRGAFPLLLPSSVLSLVVVAARSGKLRSPANGAVSEAPSHWSHLVVREREIGKKMSRVFFSGGTHQPAGERARTLPPLLCGEPSRLRFFPALYSCRTAGRARDWDSSLSIAERLLAWISYAHKPMMPPFRGRLLQ